MRTIKFALLGLLICSSAIAEESRQKSRATYIPIQYRNSSTGALISGATGSDCECSNFADGSAMATFADCTNEATEAATSSGVYYLSLTAAEMGYDYVTVKCSCSSTNCTPYVVTINTASELRGAYKTAQAATGTSLQLAASESYANDELNNTHAVYIVSASAGAGQYRCITDYVSSTDTATVATWTTTPSGTIIYDIVADAGCGASSGGSVTIANGGITSASFASGAITADAIAADAIGASEIAASAITASEIATDAVGADEVAADAIGITEIASPARNMLADVFWRRNSSNIESSSYGDTLILKSGYGVIAQQTHKSQIVGDVLTNYKSDGATSLQTRTLTSSSSAAPITGIGN